MKTYKYSIFITIAFMLFVPQIIYADYGMDKQDVIDYKDFFDELFPAEEENSKCTTVGTVYAECSGVTVSGYGTYDLETYVTGVLTPEFGGLNDSDEMMKAAAIAIRSYTIGHTNNCKNSITSSSNDQNFNDDSTYARYAKETEGIVITYNGNVIVAPYSALYKSNCDSVYVENGEKICKVTNETWFGSGQFYDITVPYDFIPDWSGGYHHKGMAVWAVYYYAKVKGYNAEKLLRMSYGENIQFAKLNLSGKSSSSSGSSFVCNDDTDGEYVMSDDVKFTFKNYNIEGTSQGLGRSFDLTVGNVSQCPWYAKYRAIEIVESSTLSEDLKNKAKAVLLSTSGNGNDWYGGRNSNLSYFKYTSDINKAKAGSIIAWERNTHNMGHVGIVEKVNSDGSLVISEGWNMGGPYGADVPSNIKIITTTYTLDEVQTYRGGGTFIGYTYLLSHKK